MSMTFFYDEAKQISYMICINLSQNLIFVKPLLNLSNPMKQNHSICGRKGFVYLQQHNHLA